MSSKLRSRYSLHVLHAHLGGYQPLTLRQFVAVRAAMAFEGGL
jgi:hypothetical protein